MCLQQPIPCSKSLYHHFQLSQSPRATQRCRSFPPYSGFDRLYTNENPSRSSLLTEGFHDDNNANASHQLGPDESNASDSHLPSFGPLPNTNLKTVEACVGSNPSEHVEIRVGDESNPSDLHLPSSGPYGNANLETAEVCVGSNPNEQVEIRIGDESNPSDLHLPSSGPHGNTNIETAEACVGSNPNEHVEIRVGDESNPNDLHLPSSSPHGNTNLEKAEACPGSNPNKHVEIRVSDESNPSDLHLPSSSPHANTNLETAKATSSDSEWNLLFTSFVIETVSAAFDLSSSPRKPQYTLIGMLLAIAAVLVCIWELVHKGKKEGVLSGRRGVSWTLYYPPPKNKMFCPFPEIAGLSLAITQFICSGVQYHLYRSDVTCPIILDILTAILVFCSLVLLHIKLLRLVAYATFPNGTEATTGFK